MKAEIFCLAEAATVKNNQMCILHTLSQVWAMALPAPISFLLCVQVRFTQEEEGSHRLQYELTNADGIILRESPVCVIPVRFFGDLGFTQSYCTLFLVEAELMQGQYEIRLLGDGAEIASTVLGVQKIIQK